MQESKETSNNIQSNQHTFRVVITHNEDGTYIAEIPSIKHCIVAGETIEEAMKYLDEVLEATLEIMQEEGWPIPNDSEMIEYTVTKEIKTYSNIAKLEVA